MSDAAEPKMSMKGWNLAVKDFFPTPELFNEGVDEGQKVRVCYAGAGITIREHYACEMMKALVSKDGVGLADAVEGGEIIIAERAVRLADSLIEYLANNEPDRESS